MNVVLRADPETGEALCVACGLCARICPTSCLEMNVLPSEEGDRELGEFILRSGRCLFCGFCAQVCPVDAITMSGEFELATMEREGMIYTKTELASIGAQNPTWWAARWPACWARPMPPLRYATAKPETCASTPSRLTCWL